MCTPSLSVQTGHHLCSADNRQLHERGHSRFLNYQHGTLSRHPSGNCSQSNSLTLWLCFLLPSTWHGDNLYISWPCIEFFRSYCLAQTFLFGTRVSQVDLSAIRGTIVESCGLSCQPSVASSQVLWANLSANRRERVKLTLKTHLFLIGYNLPP